MATISIIQSSPEFELTVTLEEARALQQLLDSRMSSIQDDEGKILDILSSTLDDALHPFRGM